MPALHPVAEGRTSGGTAFAAFGPERAPAVVLIHGLGLTWSTTWAGLIPALAARYRIIAFDLWGHGASAAPPEPPSLALFARQTSELLDALGIDRAALLGFSLGGMINRRIALDSPARVAGLAILNSPHERGAEAQAAVEARARDSAAGGPAATIEATLARWFTPEFRAQDPEAVARIRATVLANDPHSYAACRWVLARGVVELIRRRPALTGPALVMTCENDTGSTPEMARAIASEIAGAELVIVPRLQHLGLIEAPTAFTRPLLEHLAAAFAPAGHPVTEGPA
ncbi:MAG: alpha/beta fold hydrolase [Pikeienuella sp.]